jgi:hypothetical protein
MEGNVGAAVGASRRRYRCLEIKQFVRELDSLFNAIIMVWVDLAKDIVMVGVDGRTKETCLRRDASGAQRSRAVIPRLDWE